MRGFFLAKKSATTAMNIFIKHPLLVAAPSLLILIASAKSFSIITYDPYWLLTQGRDWLAGIDPLIDHYSFSYNGTPINSNTPWFGIAFAWLTQLTNLHMAAQILRLIAALLTVLFVWRLASNSKNWTFAGLGAIAIFAGLQFRYFLRPELFDYCLFIGTMLFFKQAHTQYGWKQFLFLGLLTVVWSNYHAGIFTYVIGLGLYIDSFLAEPASRESLIERLKFLFPSGIILLALGFLTPTMSHPVIENLKFSHEWSELILEHKTFDEKFDSTSLAYILFPSSMLIALLALKFREYGIALIIAVLTYAAWERIRMVSFLGAGAGAGLIIITANSNFERIFENLPTLIKKSTTWLSIIACIAMTFLMFNTFQRHSEKKSDLPYEITKYLESKDAHGNIINTMSTGGWLQYKLGPNLKIHIDGRTNILFPIELLKESIAMEAGNPDVIQKTLNDHNVDYILFRKSRSLFSTLIKTSAFRPEYITDRFTLYSKDKKSLTLTGLLLNYPMCWRSELLPRLQEEITTVRSRYPKDSSESVFLQEFISVETLRPNSDQAQNHAQKMTDDQLRALAYLYLQKGMATQAGEMFGLIANANILDLLTQAHAHVESRELREASELILLVVSGYWQENRPAQRPLTSSQLALAERLTKEIRLLSEENIAEPLETNQNSHDGAALLELLDLVSASIEKQKLQNAEMATASMSPQTFVYTEHCQDFIAQL